MVPTPTREKGLKQLHERRKLTGPSESALRLTWMVSGGRDMMAGSQIFPVLRNATRCFAVEAEELFDVRSLIKR